MSLFWVLASHEMSLLVISVVASIIDFTTTAPVPRHQEIVEITLLEEAWNSDRRSRRDADSNLPDRLSFAVPVASDRAVLDMARSSLLPVKMSDEESTRAANSFSEEAAVYTDLSSSSSMIVKRESGNYMLRGTFVHEDVAWTLQYETRHKRDASNATSVPHRISHLVAPTMASVGDTVKYPEVPTKRNSTENNTPKKDAEDLENFPNSEKPTLHFVEIAFIVDYPDYIKWVKYVGLADAPREMRLWYTFVAESMYIRYQNIKDPDIAISTTVTVLRILSDADDAGLFSNRTNNLFMGEEGLETFQEWCLDQEDLPASDHYTLFTGLDLTSIQDGDIEGISFFETLCTEASVSIVENDFNENVGHTVAHELAHSLSSYHDGDPIEEDGCSPEYWYIMSELSTIPVDPDREGNDWIFSPCSIASFKLYLDNVTCTREMNSDKPALPAPTPGERAGEVLSRNDQCRLAFQNRTSYFCKVQQLESDSMEALCRGMFCYNPGSQLCEYIMPQEFTQCGDNKWCRSGKCADKYEANTATSLQQFTEASGGRDEEEEEDEDTTTSLQHFTGATGGREEEEEEAQDTATSPQHFTEASGDKEEPEEEEDSTTSLQHFTGATEGRKQEGKEEEKGTVTSLQQFTKAIGKIEEGEEEEEEEEEDAATSQRHQHFTKATGGREEEANQKYTTSSKHFNDVTVRTEEEYEVENEKYSMTSMPTATTNDEQPSSAAATATAQLTGSSSSQNVINSTAVSPKSTTAQSTTFSLPSRLSAISSSVTTIDYMTFGVCLFFLSEM